jgi:tRNA-specific 2-thiouridylase
LPAASDGARYVTRIDAPSNTIVIGREEELESRGLIATEVNVIRPERFATAQAPVLAMVRYRATPVPALATIEGDTLRLEFERPLRAVSPGQLVALFDRGGDEVLAAATITRAN